MSLFTLIPVKPFAEGKTRLSQVLSDEERCRLNRSLFEHVLTVVTTTLGGASTLIVSADQTALGVAVDRGAQAVQENAASGLNQALQIGAKAALAKGAGSLLILPTDLPYLTPNDLAALLDRVASPPCMVIAPDQQHQGTNALLLSPPDTVAFSYGKNSFALHCRAARAAGMDPVVVTRPGLAFDLDTPDDYKRLGRCDGETGFGRRTGQG